MPDSGHSGTLANAAAGAGATRKPLPELTEEIRQVDVPVLEQPLAVDDIPVLEETVGTIDSNRDRT